jgi:hypothetical protein
MKSTAAIREEEVKEHRFCFNPYLEGTHENGLYANCLSCHSLAAYSSVNNSSLLATGKDTLGVRYPYPLTERRTDETSYFQHAVRTGFLWSVADNQNTSLPAQIVTIREQLLDQFENQLKLNLTDK